MTGKIDIRDGRSSDRGSIDELYRQAVPGQDLRPLVADLLTVPDGVDSIVAEIGQAFAGHMILTESGVTGSRRRCAMIGPLAVVSGRQNQGVGSALVEAGLKIARERHYDRALLLGDPAYYGKFGFSVERNVLPPYDLPAEWRDAWLSAPVGRMDPDCRGTLTLPTPWLNADHWKP